MKYSLGEEIANAITHGIGALFSIVALTIMVVFAVLYGNTWQVISVAIYGRTLVLLYTTSTLYHAITNTRAKKVFKIFDHASIYLLIAGTYTPFTLVVLRNDGMTGWTIFILIWTLAIIGIVLSTIFIGKMRVLSTIAYIFLGCVVFFAMPQLVNQMKINNAMPGIYFLVAGGIAYIAGTAFYIFKVKYFHSIWHCFVLLASVLHFISVMFYVL
jgi:hemolysin III